MKIKVETKKTGIKFNEEERTQFFKEGRLRSLQNVQQSKKKYNRKKEKQNMKGDY